MPITNFPAYTGTALSRDLGQVAFDEAEEYFQAYQAAWAGQMNTTTIPQLNALEQTCIDEAAVATTKAGEALASANNADASELLASKWATEAEDVPVSGGLYSAFHWATKAYEYVATLATGAINDSIISTVATWSSTFLAAKFAPLSPYGNAVKNKIVDGAFNFWLEGTTQTTSGYGSATMCKSLHSGSSKTTSQQAFTLGQTDVGGNPTYFKRTIVTSAAGAANYVRDEFFIEDVAELAGKTWTLSFDAKADSVKNVAIELVQSFGSGGSPSADVTGIGAQLISLGATWARKTATIAVPSITGKTVGTDGVRMSYTKVVIWYEAGSDYNIRTATLGQQSGTFDIAMVQLEEGDTPTAFEDAGALEEVKVDRTYQRFTIGTVATVASAETAGAYHSFRTPMRATPAVQAVISEYASGFDASAAAVIQASIRGFLHYKVTNSPGPGQSYAQTAYADCRF